MTAVWCSRIALLIALTPALFAAGAQLSSAAQTSVKSPAAAASSQSGAPALPATFAGLPREGQVATAPMPPDADPQHAALLKEDGLRQASTAHYTGAGGAGWTVSLLRFGDATGAYAAWTADREQGMRPEAAGDNAAASPSLFLAQKSLALLLVRGAGASDDATKLQPAVQALLAELPVSQGPEGVLPTLPGLLPAEGLAKGTQRYAIGPAGYLGPLPSTTIDWSRDAEVVTAEYHLRGGERSTLTLLMFPTPQIAGTALRTVAELPDSSLHVATRRTGPLVAVVSGAGVSQPDAQRLLNAIRYVSDLTLDQPQGYTSEVAKAAKLLLGIGYLIIFLAIAALVIALFLGGGRVLVRRLRGKPASSLHDEDFISLKL